MYSLAVLGVTTNSDGCASGETRVDGVDGSERIGHDLVVRERSIGARLERRRVARRRGRVERVDRAEDSANNELDVGARGWVNSRVGVLAAPSSAVDVRDDVSTRGRPEGLQEAQDVAGSRVVDGVRRSHGRRERQSFDECAVLRGDSEERRSLNLFPQVEAGLVPVSDLEVHPEWSAAIEWTDARGTYNVS